MTNNSRNATSIWNGYSHQGKVGIFVALKQICKLMTNRDSLNNWKVVFEQSEDFDIVDNNLNPVSRHQVKCKYSSSTMNSMGVFGPNDFSALENGENYLHSVTEISDYVLNDVNKNPNGIKLYEYEVNKNYCYNEINDYINKEIKDILAQEGHAEKDNLQYIDQVNAEISQKLSLVLQQQHSSSQNKPELYFDEILSIIKSYNFKDLAVNVYKRKFFETYENYVKCSELENIAINSKLNDIVISIMNSDDDKFIKFITNLFIDKKSVFQKYDYGEFIAMFNADGLRDVFFHFLNTTNCGHEVNSETVSYKSEYVLTAINASNNRTKGISEDIWENIRLSKSVNPFEKSKIINKEIDCVLGEKITSYYDVNQKEKILNPKEISLIPQNNAKNILEN